MITTLSHLLDLFVLASVFYVPFSRKPPLPQPVRRLVRKDPKVQHEEAKLVVMRKEHEAEIRRLGDRARDEMNRIAEAWKQRGR